ncbi:MAG TPA: hypothetical protein VIM73_13555 [Polyangiaceae bacterium]
MKDVERQQLLDGPSTPPKGDERRLGDSAAHTRLWSEVSAAVGRETGVRAWFRSRPTRERRAWALAAALPVAMIGSSRRNEDWLEGAGAAPWVWFGVFNLLVVLCVLSLLRPLGKAPSSGLNFVPLLLAAGFPALHVLLEGLDAQSATRSVFGHGLACFLFGASLSLPFVAIVLALDRSDRPSLLWRVLVGATGGLLANGALVLHCADRASPHLWVSHVSIGAALALLGIVVAGTLNRHAGRADRPGSVR